MIQKVCKAMSSLFFRTMYWLGAIAVGGLALAPTLWASMDTQAWDARLECAEGFRTGEPITARLTFWTMPNCDCQRFADSVLVDITVLGSLTHAGPPHWRMELHNDTSFTREIELTIPDNDTTAIFFAIWWGKSAGPYKLPCYFVTTGPEIELFYGPPTPIGPMPWEVEAATRRMGDSLERIELQRPPYPPDGIIGRAYYNIAPEDSVYLDSISETSKKHFVRMRMMEDSVWAGQDRQVYMIEQLYFARNPGEKRFRRIEGHTDPLEEGTRWRDSVLAVSPPAQYDIIIDLRDPDHYTYARTLVDSLGKTEEKGYYRTVTTKAVLGKLAEHGIAFRNTLWRTRPSDQQEKDTARSKIPGTGELIEGNGRDNRSDLFIEDFEGSWPGQWFVQDGVHQNGLDYWGKSDFRVFSGSWSVWCAGEGDMIDGGHYDDHMSANMQTVNPVDLTDFVNKRIRYRVYYDTEPTYDYLERQSSTDGFIWITNERRSGYSGGWQTIEQPVPTTGPLYIRFVFVSDYVGNYYEGVYLDDIKVTGDPVNAPNLAWNWPTHYWRAILPSNDSGTYSLDDLYGIDPTYIDWSM